MSNDNESEFEFLSIGTETPAAGGGCDTAPTPAAAPEAPGDKESSIEQFASAHPRKAAAAAKVAVQRGIDKDDPAWDLARAAADVEKAATAAADSAAKAADLLSTAAEILTKTGEAATQAISMIPDIMRDGARGAGVDVRGQIMVAAKDATKTISDEVRQSLADAAPAAARAITQQVIPAVARAAAGGSRAKWMLAGVLLVIAGAAAGAGGAYYAGQAIGRITPPRVTATASADGSWIWRENGYYAIRGGRGKCPAGAWMCTAPARQ